MKTFTINAIPVPGDTPPDVHFVIADDLRSFAAEPEGAAITVERTGEHVSRVQLWDSVRGGRSVDMDLRDPEETSVEQWRDSLAYAAEVACALYWSQWRSQLAARLAGNSPGIPDGSGGAP